VDPSVKEHRVKELESKLKRREIPPAEDMEFWTKVAGQERIREVVLNGMSPCFPSLVSLTRSTDVQNSGVSFADPP
jgi:hypothetical protein